MQVVQITNNISVLTYNSRDWNHHLLDVAFKKLHIRIGEHNYVQADEIDNDDQDLGIDPIDMERILKSNIILKIGHLHFSKINTVDAKKWMDQILEKLCENQNCLTSLEIRNCEMVSSLKVEKLLPNLQTLVLFDRTGHDNFFKSRAKFSVDFATRLCVQVDSFQ